MIYLSLYLGNCSVLSIHLCTATNLDDDDDNAYLFGRFIHHFQVQINYSTESQRKEAFNGIKGIKISRRIANE